MKQDDLLTNSKIQYLKTEKSRMKKDENKFKKKTHTQKKNSQKL